MLGSTHALIGGIAGLYIAHSSHASPAESIAMIGLCALSALLPDVDHPNSRIRNTTGFAGDLAFGWLHHRGITHSMIALIVLALLAIAAFPSRTPATVFAVGYGSHLLADLITPSGVPLFAPLTWRRVRIPLIETGSLLEMLFAVSISAGALWVIFQ